MEPSAADLEQRIEALIRELGDERMRTRDHATEELKRIGEPAASAIEKASVSDDVEVRIRAKEILADIRLGITPDWPAEMIALVRRYRAMNHEGRTETLQKLQSSLEHRSVPFLIQRLRAANADEAAQALACLKRMEGEKTAGLVIRLLAKPKTLSERRALAWALAQVHRGAEALATLRPDDENDGTRDELLAKGIAEAIGCLKKHRNDEAAKLARALAQAAPDDARFPYLEAEALNALDRPDEARALREKATVMNPDSEASHFLAAEMLLQMERRRLAEAELKKILDIAPHKGVYDVNAWLRLSAIYETDRRYREAKVALATALNLYRDGCANQQGFCLIGGDENAMNEKVAFLERKTAEQDAAAKKPGGLMDFNVNITVKDAKLKELRDVLRTADATLTMNVQPRELRLLDLKDVTLRYDLARKELLALLHGSPAGPGRPLALKEKRSRVVVNMLDCVYLYEINAASGEVRRLKRFEKDYTIRGWPGESIRAMKDGAVKINGKEYTLEDVANGVPMDFLPERLQIEFTGTSADGKPHKHEWNVNVLEPADLPADPKEEE